MENVPIEPIWFNTAHLLNGELSPRSPRLSNALKTLVLDIPAGV